MKEKNKLLRYLNEVLKIGLGFERLFFFILIFVLSLHIVSCLWLICANLYAPYAEDENGKPDDTLDYSTTWLGKFREDNDMTSIELYAVALYWAVTTITTVGYGDISGTNNAERLFAAVMMIFGVMLFSYANGSLSSIIQNYDSTNAKYQEKLNILNRIYKEYKLPLDLFIKIKKSMGYESKNNMQDLHLFLDELPYKLKTEVSLYVYEQRYVKIKLFRSRSVSFILWMCPLLKPSMFTEF
jgi:hypothetical protein